MGYSGNISRRRSLKALYAALGFAGIAAAGLGYGSDTARAQSDDPVNIGFIASLTLPGSVLEGQRMVRGAELGIEYINANGGVLGGRKLKLVVQNDSGQAANGVAAYRSLVNEFNVPIVYGIYNSATAIAVGEVAEQVGTPLLVTEAGSDDITKAGHDMVFRTAPTSLSKGFLVANFFKAKGFKRVVSLMPNTAYGQTTAEALREAAAVAAPELQIEYVTFDNTAVDWTAALLAVKAKKPDVIWNGAVEPQASLIYRQAITVGLVPEVPWLWAGSIPTVGDWWGNHGQAGVGVYFNLNYSPKQELSPEGEWFKAEYQKRFGEVPNFAAVAPFSNTLVIADLLNQAKGTDAHVLVKELETGEFRGFTKKPVKFSTEKGINWHNWGSPYVIAQMTELNQAWYDAPVVATGDVPE